MVSHKNKCIFVHIPKCAGTSIEKKLGLNIDEKKRGYQDHRTIREIYPKSIFEMNAKEIIRFKFKKKIKYLYHHQFNQLSLTKKQFNTYFKFTIIRNPWDRVFSWYKNIMDDEMHRKKHNISEDYSFEDFVKSNHKMTELKSQLFWLIDNEGNIPFDFIGRFENLKDDFIKVSNIIGLKDAVLPELICSRDHMNYRDAYTQELIDIISQRYKEEIKLFDYDF